ncbi:MAG: NB-ARC domain-containing protein [Coleofasciculaceae cyanobacterium]
MDIKPEEVSSLLKLANTLVYKKKQHYLNCNQQELLKGVLTGLKYKDIQADKTNELHYQKVEYIGTYVAHELWKLLTEIFQDIDVLSSREKVCAKNVRVYLQRIIKQQSSTLEQANNPNNSQFQEVYAQDLIIQEEPSTLSGGNPLYCINASSIQQIFTAIHWVGRTDEIAELTNKLLKGCRVLSIVGITGIGKTTLAGRLTIEPAILQAFPTVKLIDFDSKFSSFDGVTRCILGDEIAADEVLRQHPEKLVAAIVGKLQTQPLLLVLDMVEELLEIDSNGIHHFKESIFDQFFEKLIRSETMASRIIITSQYKLPIIAEGRHPTRIATFRLAGLEEIEALELFEAHNINQETDLSKLSDVLLLKRIIRVYEGHPLALKVIAGEIQEVPYQGNIQAYWYDYGKEIETVEQLKSFPEEVCQEDKPRLDRYSINLTELVKMRVEKTFSRLFKSAPLACLMLCMGAKYRRAVERQAWLMLIDDYSDDDSLIAFQTLQRRFLLEEEYTPHKVLYRLHNLIRRVALDNLSKIEDEILPL